MSGSELSVFIPQRSKAMLDEPSLLPERILGGVNPRSWTSREACCGPWLLLAWTRVRYLNTAGPFHLVDSRAKQYIHLSSLPIDVPSISLPLQQFSLNRRTSIGRCPVQLPYSGSIEPCLEPS